MHHTTGRNTEGGTGAPQLSANATTYLLPCITFVRIVDALKDNRYADLCDIYVPKTNLELQLWQGNVSYHWEV